MADDEFRVAERDEWGVGWESHRLHQLTLALEATPAQRLIWLEQMITLAHQVGALPKPKADRIPLRKTTE